MRRAGAGVGDVGNHEPGMVVQVQGCGRSLVIECAKFQADEKRVATVELGLCILVVRNCGHLMTGGKCVGG